MGGDTPKPPELPPRDTRGVYRGNFGHPLGILIPPSCLHPLFFFFFWGGHSHAQTLQVKGHDRGPPGMRWQRWVPPQIPPPIPAGPR